MPHIHISTEALFFGGAIVVGLVTCGIAWGRSKRQAKLDQKEADYRHEERMMALRSAGTVVGRYRSKGEPGNTAGQTPRGSVPPSNPSYAPQAAQPMTSGAPMAAVAPTVVVTDGFGGSGFMTGMLMGELLADEPRERDVYVESAPAYIEPGPVDSGVSYDSGSSGSDSGISYDSGSSGSDSGGGFDINW